eukprot:gene17221-biopygen18860
MPAPCPPRPRHSRPKLPTARAMPAPRPRHLPPGIHGGALTPPAPLAAARGPPEVSSAGQPPSIGGPRGPA